MVDKHKPISNGRGTCVICGRAVEIVWPEGTEWMEYTRHVAHRRKGLRP